MLACVVSKLLQEISWLASTSSQVLWGWTFPLIALTEVKYWQRNEHRGDSDPYKNAVRRHGLVRGLSVSSELQWLTRESASCQLSLFTHRHTAQAKNTRTVSDSAYRNPASLISVSLITILSCLVLIQPVKHYRSQSEMSCLKPLSRPLNVSTCFRVGLL